jgi:hypothetical protein
MTLSFDARSQRSTEPGRRDSRRFCVAPALAPHDHEHRARKLPDEPLMCGDARVDPRILE